MGKEALLSKYVLREEKKTKTSDYILISYLFLAFQSMLLQLFAKHL